MSDYGIVPPTGVYGNSWPSEHVLTQGKHGSISVAGWNLGAEGIPQQTFLGASIISWNVSAGFGDTSSQLTVDVVNDEYNKSDGLGYGAGDDIYHNGKADLFRPPVVGSPVFFKYGMNPATIEQAFLRVVDEAYQPDDPSAVCDKPGFPIITTPNPITQRPNQYAFRDLENSDIGDTGNTVWVDKSALWNPKTEWRGCDHFAFGGILQSYTENRGPGGNPLHTIEVVDPREILSNASIILNNYQGTTFNNKNLFNVYGFLEYDPSDKLQDDLDTLYDSDPLTKNVDNEGIVTYSGDDTYRRKAFKVGASNVLPITGQGFSRRGDNGIPWYRVAQGLRSLFGWDGPLDDEFQNAGFGGTIDFRGFQYVVDFNPILINKIPQMYFLDYDQMTIMDLAQELADVISHDLYVSLLPVIDHPQMEEIYNYNQGIIDDPNQNNNQIVAGVIYVDVIDRSKQPDYFAIRDYLQDLADNGVAVENQDVGYELSNVVTDKFIVGANEVEMFYFSNHRDRNNLQLQRKNNGLDNDYEFLETEQWYIDTSLKQQILPFYGFLGETAVTIPRGFGSYQQILLDTQGLNAVGLGNYYIATELELRKALQGYKQWANFLANYSELYIEDLSANRILNKNFAKAEIENFTDDAIQDYIANNEYVNQDSLERLKNGEYGVTVPRCLFNSDKNYMGIDGFPASPCSPPFGYPLYYKRAEKIGIAQVGALNFEEKYRELITNYSGLKKRLEEKLANGDEQIAIKDEDIVETTDSIINGTTDAVNWNNLTPESKKLLQQTYENAETATEEYYALVGEAVKTATLIRNKASFYKNMKDAALDGEKNAKKIHAFLKAVAEDNLGRKFLVKIPKACNLAYEENLTFKEDKPGTFVFTPTPTSPTPSPTAKVTVEVQGGPFGFKPQPINADAGYGETFAFKQAILSKYNAVKDNDREIYNHYLDVNAPAEYTYGALKNNYNTISEKWEFNYQPFNEGGFFNYQLFDKNISQFKEIETDVQYNKLPLATRQGLCPKDLSKIIKENGRVKCYARFDNSQHYDMSSIPSDSITQEFGIEGNPDTFVPDFLEELDNTNTDYRFSLDRIRDLDAGKIPTSISYVNCQVENQLYLTPKFEAFSEISEAIDNPDFDPDLPEDPDTNPKRIPNPDKNKGKVRVFGRKVMWVENERPIDIDIDVNVDGELEAKAFIEDHWKIFSPASGTKGYPDNPDQRLIGGGFDGTWLENRGFRRTYNTTLKSWIVDTRRENLDPDHVYALVTVPGRIRPVIDGRYLDAEAGSLNVENIKHNLTQDVVRNVVGFEKPTPANSTNEYPYDCDDINDPESYQHAAFGLAVKAYKDAISQHARGGNADFNTSKTQPSPVYPDMIALPMLSNERCYGPWRSSTTAFSEDDQNATQPSTGPVSPRERYSDIGGKIEFVKDEKLAPWNFAGYQLMNEAGRLQASYSNSLLLFSERGAFVIPEAPTGISLAKALKDKGPLISSISVNISTGGISTNVKMDVYTARFGKLQKQKEILIAKVARERQKIIDQNNKLLRQAYFKSEVTNRDFFANLRSTAEEFVAQSEALDDLINLELTQSNLYTWHAETNTVAGVEGDQDGKPTTTQKTKEITTTSVTTSSRNKDDNRRLKSEDTPNSNKVASLGIEEVITPSVTQPGSSFPQFEFASQEDLDAYLCELADLEEIERNS